MDDLITTGRLDEQQFSEILRGIAVDTAPRLFAVAQEYGERQDGWIAAWGMAFPDHAEVISVRGDFRMRVRRPENALRAYADDEVSARLVWL